MSNIIIKQLVVGPMMNYAYLVTSKGSSSSIVIDPGWDIEKFISTAKSLNTSISAILLTHAHFDHAQVAGELAEKTKSPVYVHEAESNENNLGTNIVSTKDGMELQLAGLKITCLHTPGHTPGSQCFLIENNLFSGDTLFVDACGRVDLPGSSPEDMMNSLKRIAKLNPHIVVYPGHDYGPSPTDTIGNQKATNPFLNSTGRESMGFTDTK